MVKKILAAMLALTMCTGLSGCKNKSEKKDSSSAKDKANTSAADTDTTDDENIQTSDSKAEDTDDSKADDGNMTVSIKMNKDNFFIGDISSDCKGIPTNDELLAFSELAFEQYSAALTNDNEKFTQMLAFDKVVEPFAEVLTQKNKYGKLFSSFEEKMIYNWGSMLFEKSAVDDIDINDFIDIDADDSAVTEDFKNLIYLGLDTLDLDRFSMWKSREDLVPIGELNEDAIAYIDLREFKRNGDNMFICFSMILFNGNDMFEFEDIDVLYLDGNSYIVTDLPEHSDNECIGMTIDEIKQKIEEKKTLEKLRLAAYQVYFITENYRKIYTEYGEDFKKNLESDFPMCTSSEGLDLAGDEPEDEGDKYVYTRMHEFNHTDGKAFISGYDKDLDFIEKAGYTSADGVTGYYPDEE